jgi:hypothetical protein
MSRRHRPLTAGVRLATCDITHGPHGELLYLTALPASSISSTVLGWR